MYAIQNWITITQKEIINTEGDFSAYQVGRISR